MSTLRLRLYRTLLQKARHFDANPAMKGVLKDLDHFEPLQLRSLYSPSMQKSFVQLVKDVFRQPRREGVDEELGFNVMRYLNEVDAKYFKVLYPSAAEGAIAPASSVPTKPSPRDPQSHSLAPTKQHQLLRRLARMADRYWAMPIPLGEQTSVAEAENAGALVPSIVPPNQTPGKNRFHALTPGVVLATHPLAEWPFSKCVMLVMDVGPDYVSAVILNYPRVYPVGERNFVFPTPLRRQTCHVGGPILSYDMPPIPNYHIIHPFPKIPNSKVLLPDEERPVCVSTGEDIAAIAAYMRERNVSPDEFIIFAGSVVMPKPELQRQMQEGFWMPILTSSEFVHASGRLGRLFWDGLMESCGGEFAHMPLISAMVERWQAEAEPTVQ